MKRWLWVGILLAALAVLLLLGRFSAEQLPALVAWVRGLGAWGPLGFVLVYATSTVLLVPGTFPTLAAGALFGVVPGTLYAFAGATLGAALAFLTSRYLARPAVERRLQRDARFLRIDRAIGREGRRVVFLLRLSPLFPFTLLNYALGLTHVRFRDYLLASVGMLPGTLLYVYNGRVVGEIAALGADAAQRGTGHYLGLLLGVTGTVLATLYITRVARRALREEGVLTVAAAAE